MSNFAKNIMRFMRKYQRTHFPVKVKVTDNIIRDESKYLATVYVNIYTFPEQMRTIVLVFSFSMGIT